MQVVGVFMALNSKLYDVEKYYLKWLGALICCIFRVFWKISKNRIPGCS